MTVKDNDNLALVLERINLLMQTAPEAIHVNDEPSENAKEDENIPLLVDVYTGDIAQLKQRENRQVEINAVIKEMQPYIKLEIKKAVLKQTVELEAMLAKQLETDLIKTLSERLQTI
ncbi:MAG: hypothetical protein H7Z18_00715 [Methylophilaceae bacterium]|nr:hypothetical protein [Methylophilaceae bacterium]